MKVHGHEGIRRLPFRDPITGRFRAAKPVINHGLCFSTPFYCDSPVDDSDGVCWGQVYAIGRPQVDYLQCQRCGHSSTGWLQAFRYGALKTPEHAYEA